MGQCVLVLNCGSSSIKFAIVEGESGKSVLTGLAENLGNDDSVLSICHSAPQYKIKFVQ